MWGPPQRADGIFVVAACFMRTAALTGPPRPCVYCLRKCFGGQKPGAALKVVVSNRLMHIWIEGGGGRWERRRVCGAWRKTFRVGGWWRFRPRGHMGATAWRRIPANPPPRCQCYDMCTALLFSLTTRALHLPGWPSLIKKLDLHAGYQTVQLLLFLLHLRFTSCGPGPDRQGW